MICEACHSEDIKDYCTKCGTVYRKEMHGIYADKWAVALNIRRQNLNKYEQQQDKIERTKNAIEGLEREYQELCDNYDRNVDVKRQLINKIESITNQIEKNKQLKYQIAELEDFITSNDVLIHTGIAPPENNKVRCTVRENIITVHSDTRPDILFALSKKRLEYTLKDADYFFVLNKEFKKIDNSKWIYTLKKNFIPLENGKYYCLISNGHIHKSKKNSFDSNSLNSVNI